MLRFRAIPGPTLLLLSGMVAALGACDKVQPITDGGIVDFQCSSSVECAQGFLCHRELLRCVCTGDDSCPGALFCNPFTGRCVEEFIGCGSDLDCAANEYCDVPIHTCFPRRPFCVPCTEDQQCGSSSDRCVVDTTFDPPRSFCGQACSTDSDCTREETTCQDIDGIITCWPEVATCEQLEGCTPDTGQACTQDDDCTDGADQECDLVQGTCVADSPTCAYGQVCDRGTSRCTAQCITDDDCNLNPDCENVACRCTNNQCLPISICGQDSDCEPGKVCIVEPGQSGGECGRACEENSDCPQGLVCAPIGSRKVCTPGCLTSADCSLAENCSGGQCVTGCQTHEICQLCQLCEPLNTQVNECRARKDQYCQACTAPPSPPSGRCWTSGGTQPYIDSYCCDQSPNPAVWGIPCRLGCPPGFACVALVDGGGTIIARNCFPSGNTCNDPSCL